MAQSKYLVVIDTSHYPEVYGPYDLEFAQAAYKDKVDYHYSFGTDQKVYLVEVLDSDGTDQTVTVFHDWSFSNGLD